jgi:hypothetical protein
MTGGRRRHGRTLILVGSLVCLLMLTAAGHALAAGPALNLGAAADSDPPSVAVGPFGDALVVWSTPSTVKYCVVPRNQTQCAQSGTLTPAGGENEIGSVTALADADGTGADFTILADAYGNDISDLDYAGVQEWASTDDGATFVPADGGLAVSSAILNGDTVATGGVAVPGALSLGFGFVTAIGAPTFNAFAASDPSECSGVSCPQGFATLEPASNPDQVGNLGAQYGGNGAGVMGIFETNFTSGPLGCPAGKAVPFGVAYAFGEGGQTVTNNYNVSPGLPDSAWKVPVTQALCNVEYPALSAGADSFAILAQDDLSGDTIYDKLNASDTFGKPITVDTQGEQEPSVSQDSAGNVYAVFRSGDSEGPVSLAFAYGSNDTFIGPAPLDPAGETVEDLTSDVDGSGHGYLAWLGGGSIHGQSFEYSDAVAPATVSPTTTTTADAVTVGVTCSELPCKVQGSLTAPAAAVSRVGSKKPATSVVLGTGTAKITHKGAQPLVVKLNRRGRRVLAAHRGALRLTLGVVEKAVGATVTSSRSVTVSAPKAKGGHHR